METKDFKKQLENITAQLEQVKGSLAVCDQMVEDGIIAIVSGKKLEKEDEKPISLTVSSSELISSVLVPLKKELGLRKEMILSNIEKDLIGNKTKEPVEEEKKKD